MITSLAAAVILAAVALYCLLRPAPGPRALLLAHRLDEAQRQAELEAIPPDGEWQSVVDAVFAPPDCHDCTPDWACRVHDGCYWRALEATEGLDR